MTDSTSSPYLCVICTETHTPSSDIGAEPMSIQPASRARTFPIRRCCTAPTVLKAAPWAMSVPIAVAGGMPKRKTRIGVIREPPPMPVIPTSTPVKRPTRAYSQFTAAEPTGCVCCGRASSSAQHPGACALRASSGDQRWLKYRPSAPARRLGRGSVRAAPRVSLPLVRVSFLPSPIYRPRAQFL